MRPAPLGLLLLASCAGLNDRTRVPDYERPFQIVTLVYAVPTWMGIADHESVGGWEEPKEMNLVKGVTRRPVRKDTDGGFVNYVLHPLAGSETHIMARDHGWTIWEAFLFDLFGSFYWEYAFEGMFEPPSLQDLIVTAPIGALLGEARFQLKLSGVAPGLMDPFGRLYESEWEFPLDTFMLGYGFSF